MGEKKMEPSVDRNENVTTIRNLIVDAGGIMFPCMGGAEGLSSSEVKLLTKMYLSRMAALSCKIMKAIRLDLRQ